MDWHAQHRPPALETWQAIADYLGVAKRTAQNYERLQNLPVYRLEGDKARVWAYAAELDGWRERFRQTLPEDFAVDGSSVKTEPVGSERALFVEFVDEMLPPVGVVVGQALTVEAVGTDSAKPFGTKGGTVRRQWLRYAVTLAGGLGIGAAAVKMPGLFHGHQPPSAYRVEGATLILLGRDGSELWRYTFRQQMSETSYKTHPEKLCCFSDLEGNGSVSTLFRYCPADPRADQSFLCFNPNGRIRWKFEPGKEVVDNIGRRFTRPYYVSSFVAVRSPDMDRSHVVVNSAHNWSFPAQTAILDGETGSLISEYWHRGHLTELAIADLDHDGHPKILLGGVNDASDYKCATLVVFDHRRVSGATQDPLGQPYFRNMPTGTEKWTLFFPKTPISEREEFNRVNYLLVTADRIRVNVSEGIFTESPVQVVYELDYNLRPINAVLSGELIAEYKKLQAAGELPVESPHVTAERLMHQIKVIKGS